MSKRKAPKTSGALWLYHSMSAFNGYGYADKSLAKEKLREMVKNIAKN